MLLLVATITISCSRSENDDDTADHSGVETSGMHGEVSWKYNESTKTLTFSGTGKLIPVKIYYKDYRKLDFEKVVIEKGITSIGEGAFEGCIGLTSVAIPNSVTSIERAAFYGCI